MRLQLSDLVVHLKGLGINMHRVAICLRFRIGVILGNAERRVNDVDFRYQTLHGLDDLRRGWRLGLALLTLAAGRQRCGEGKRRSQDADNGSAGLGAQNRDTPLPTGLALKAQRAPSEEAKHPVERAAMSVAAIRP